MIRYVEMGPIRNGRRVSNEVNEFWRVYILIMRCGVDLIGAVRSFSRFQKYKSCSRKEKQIWVTREKKIKAEENDRKRPSLTQRKNED